MVKDTEQTHKKNNDTISKKNKEIVELKKDLSQKSLNSMDKKDLAKVSKEKLQLKENLDSKQNEYKLLEANLIKKDNDMSTVKGSLNAQISILNTENLSLKKNLEKTTVEKRKALGDLKDAKNEVKQNQVRLAEFLMKKVLPDEKNTNLPENDTKNKSVIIDAKQSKDPYSRLSDVKLNVFDSKINKSMTLPNIKEESRNLSESRRPGNILTDRIHEKQDSSESPNLPLIKAALIDALKKSKSEGFDLLSPKKRLKVSKRGEEIKPMIQDLQCNFILKKEENSGLQKSIILSGNVPQIEPDAPYNDKKTFNSPEKAKNDEPIKKQSSVSNDPIKKAKTFDSSKTPKNDNKNSISKNSNKLEDKKELEKDVKKDAEDKKEPKKDVKSNIFVKKEPEKGVKTTIEDKKEPKKDVKSNFDGKKEPEKGVKTNIEDKKEPKKDLKSNFVVKKEPEKGMKTNIEDKKEPKKEIKNSTEDKKEPQKDIKNDLKKPFTPINQVTSKSKNDSISPDKIPTPNKFKSDFKPKIEKSNSPFPEKIQQEKSGNIKPSTQKHDHSKHDHSKHDHYKQDNKKLSENVNPPRIPTPNKSNSKVDKSNAPTPEKNQQEKSGNIKPSVHKHDHNKIDNKKVSESVNTPGLVINNVNPFLQNNIQAAPNPGLKKISDFIMARSANFQKVPNSNQSSVLGIVKALIPPVPTEKSLNNELDFKELFKDEYPHKSKIRRIMSYNNDKSLISGDEEGRIVIWKFDLQENNKKQNPNKKNDTILNKNERIFKDKKISFVDLGRIHNKRITSINVFPNFAAVSSLDQSFSVIDLIKNKVSYKQQCDFEINCSSINLDFTTQLLGVGKNLNIYPLNNEDIVLKKTEVWQVLKSQTTPSNGSITCMLSDTFKKENIYIGTSDGCLLKVNFSTKEIQLNFNKEKKLCGSKTISSMCFGSLKGKNYLFFSNESRDQYQIDTDSTELVKKYENVCTKSITDMKTSKCFRYVYIIDMDAKLNELDVHKMTFKDYGKHGVTLQTIEISLDGKYVLTGANSGKIVQWNVKEM